MHIKRGLLAGLSASHSVRLSSEAMPSGNTYDLKGIEDYKKRIRKKVCRRCRRGWMNMHIFLFLQIAAICNIRQKYVYRQLTKELKIFVIA